VAPCARQNDKPKKGQPVLFSVPAIDNTFDISTKETRLIPVKVEEDFITQEVRVNQEDFKAASAALKKSQAKPKK
jgi:hypothetical protein